MAKNNGARLLFTQTWKAIDVPRTSDSSIASNATEIKRQYSASFGAVLFDQQKSALVKSAFYRGPECIDRLMESLRDWLLWKYSQKHRILKISRVEREQLMSDPNRIVVFVAFVDSVHKVIHHWHVTDQIFGVAHAECNWKARSVLFLPVFFHNLARYDAYY